MKSRSRTYPVVNLIISFILITLFGYSQTEDVIRLDPRLSQSDFVPGVILVKVKDGITTRLGKTNGVSILGVPGIDALMQKYQAKTAEKLFPNTKPLTQKKRFKTYSGTTIEQPSLHNIYKLEIFEPNRIFEAIEELKKDENVEYAEPNFILSIVDDKPVSDILTEDDVKKMQKASTTIPNDPLYSQQTYISTIHADAVWDSTKGDSSQIIAILDTGVDWLHPDLKNKMWVNKAEANGISGVDDDGNGLVDDIRGWDFVNNDNNPTDDNSHGTHVAGIAAAEANNGIGIAGVNWYAKILPIKVFQSSGRGDVATIIKGIIYAANKGATVINMSFGSYARSLTMEAALSNAYTTSVLVAATGNNGLCIGPNKCEDMRIGQPFYPAALSYVLGVQAGDAMGSMGFSNYDPDGPIFSGYDDLFNYELKAPGVGLISTIPNGNYRVYSGTSMAAPIVSGAVSLYKNIKPEESQEMMWGNLINTSGNHFNLFSALSVKGNPKLSFVSNKIIDTLDGNGNGLVNAGETIELWFSVKNFWSKAESVYVGIQFDEFEDTTTAQILIPTAFIGAISSYATRTNEASPLRIHISTNVSHNRDIVFRTKLWNKTSSDTVIQKIIVNVQNGVELYGVMDSILVLTADRKWLVNSSFRVGTTGELIIRPGTQIIVSDGNYISVKGHVSAIGTPDSIIQISSINGYGAGFWRVTNSTKLDTFQYCSFLNMANPLKFYPTATGGGWSPAFFVDHCLFDNINKMNISFENWWLIGGIKILRHSIIRNISGDFYLYTISTSDGIDSMVYNIIENVYWGGYSMVSFDAGVIRYNNFIRNKTYISTETNSRFHAPFWVSGSNVNFGSNNIISNKPFVSANGGADIIHLPQQYWGGNNSSRNQIFDFWVDASLPLIDVEPKLLQPSDLAHGIVWKVLVDGIDPQDEKNLLNPVGEALHRFDVYFNRPMDTSFTPQLTFGVREPYTQQAVANSGHWSPDHKIWTAYKAVKLHTGDGINRIRVTSARDPENFEIPIENQRFEFVIDAAGSASIEFTAHAGLGKINLEWNKNDLVDLLGFNMYRFTNVTDTTYSDTTLINTSLITDTLFTDYKVTPGKNYYYKYKVVRTDFSESDYSRTVGAKALTSSLGDANGDLTVNVLDVVSTISYILEQTPQPFIIAAADINKDSMINVLDIVGIINIILHPSPAPGIHKTATGIARLDLNGNKVTLTSDVPVSAVQFRLEGKGLKDVQFTPDASIGQFEVASNTIGDSVKIVIIYNITGTTLAKGNTAIGTLPLLPSNVKLTEGIVADGQGKNILTNIYDNGKSLIPEEYYLSQNYPNPFNMSTKIQFGLPERAKGRIMIFNVLGQRVKIIDLGERAAGRYEITWDGMNETGRFVSSGVYFYRIEANKFNQTKKLLLIK